MAHCPKCGKRLKLTDISQFCPGCGVNMRFVDFEKNFYKEAKVAELSQANMHVKVRRMKAAFIGSKLAIARLVVMILPIVALLVPSGKFALTLPFLKDASYDFSALGVYNMFSADVLDYILKMTGSVLEPEVFGALKTALFSYAAVAVFGVIVLLTSILCFISVKNMQKINVAVSGLGIVACVVSMVLISAFAKKAQDSLLLSGKSGFGLLAVIAMFGVVLAVNLLLAIKGIPVTYDEGMVERAQIYKKVKTGAVDIDSLPQPVVETEETRKIDEEIAKEEENYKKKHEKEAQEDGDR